MIIDIHTHIFPQEIAKKALDKLSFASASAPFTDGTLEGLRRSMKEAAVDLSVILPVATNAHQVEGINDFAAGLNESFGEKELLSFASIHPDFPHVRQELSRIRALGFRGIKIHPVYQDTDLDDIQYLRIFERAAELGLIVLTHAGLDIGFPGVVRCSPEMARHAVDTVGEFPFVLAHMGGWKNWDEVPRQLADTRVYVDTSFSIGYRTPLGAPKERVMLMEQKQTMDIIHSLGADRILFGSDSPWSSPRESIEALRDLPISKDEQTKILGGNAQDLLGCCI